MYDPVTSVTNQTNPSQVTPSPNQNQSKSNPFHWQILNFDSAIAWSRDKSQEAMEWMDNQTTQHNGMTVSRAVE